MTTKRIGGQLLRIVFTASMVAYLAANSFGQNQRFIWDNGASGTSEFSASENWGNEAINNTASLSAGAVPGDVPLSEKTGATNIIIQGSFAVVDVSSPFTFANRTDQVIVRSAGTLNVGADFDTLTSPTQIGNTSAGTDTVNHTAGTWTTSNFVLGLGNSGTPDYNLSGTGILNATAISVGNGSGGESDFNVFGDQATVMATSLSLASEADLSFELGPTGVNPIDLTGAFVVDPGADLSVDLTNFTSGPGLYDLVTFGSLSGMFTDPTNVSITGFDPTIYMTDIVYDGDSLNLLVTAIPEPSALGFVGLGLFGFAARRHRK